MKMTSTQREKWTMTRAEGRQSYIRKIGILGWGIPTGIGWAFAMSATNGWDQLPILLPLGLVLFPIGGYWFGAFMWRRMEQAYQAPQT